MATPVEMPKPGNTVEECLLAKWNKRKGDPVSAGEVVAEIETDKATFEVPAPVDGTVLETFFAEGALVPVFTNIFVVGAPGESVAEFAPKAATVVPPDTRGSEPLTQSHEREGSVAAPAEQLATGRAPLSPRARRFAREHGIDTTGVRGSGPNGRILEQDLRELYFTGSRQSRLARRRTTEGTEMPAAGSGMNGMILGADLEPAPVPLTHIREKIAKRMREALSSTAQYTLNSSADATGLLALRTHVKAARKANAGVPDININELVLFCAVKALLRMPDVNAELRDGKLHRRERVHLGFAADTDRGLMVPVIRDADRMSLEELAAAAKSLADRAVNGKILLDDLSGATFTVSNLGSLGIESFTPIINAPQVAILGVDAIQPRPMRRGGNIEFIDRIGLSLTCDHQVIDGAPGARFLGVVRECIENIEALAGLSL
jgi:pyruvate dehydrogenase E2 component (dihydrolipoamide acetyltransferase)